MINQTKSNTNIIIINNLLSIAVTMNIVIVIVRHISIINFIIDNYY